MRLEIQRNRMIIIPDNAVDVACIEEVLKLKAGGDRAACIRVNAMGLSSLAYVEVKADENNEH